MPEKSLTRFAKKRAALYDQWRAQVSAMSDERNITAGQIYDNTRQIDAVLAQAIADDYAASWIDRWLDFYE